MDKETLKMQSLNLFSHIADNFPHTEIVLERGDVHLFITTSKGVFHLRTWIQHMLDCTRHIEEVKRGNIFVGGYIRDNKGIKIKISPEGGGDAIDYGKPALQYDWFDMNASLIAGKIQEVLEKGEITA